MDHFRNLFAVLNEKPFEIVVPFGGRVVRPTLGSQLDAETIKRIFKQKTIYLRPLVNLLDSDNHEYDEQPDTVSLENEENFNDHNLPDEEITSANARLETDKHNSDFSSLHEILTKLRNEINEDFSYFNIYI